MKLRHTLDDFVGVCDHVDAAHEVLKMMVRTHKQLINLDREMETFNPDAFINTD